MSELLTEKLETILVVDDSASVLEPVVAILEAANFLVLQANSAAGALTLAAGYPERIDLVLSDVDLSGMSGPQLGDALKVARPDMHLMFMSGFDGGRLLVLNYGWAFIEKRRVAAKLVEMINNVLHTRDKSQGSHQYDARKDTGTPE